MTTRAERIARARWEPTRRVAADEESLPEPQRVPEPIDGPVEFDAVPIDPWTADGGPPVVDGACDSLAATGWGSCGDCGSTRPFCICIPLPRDGWVHAESLMWWQRGMRMPPLVSTSPAGTARADAGVLPGATTLYGGSRVFDDMHDGGRLRFGIWLGGGRSTAVEGELFGLGRERDRFFADSDGNPILARPFFNIAPGGGQPAREDAELIAYPDVIEGSVAVEATTELRGAGVRFLNCWYGSHGRTQEPLTCLPAKGSRSLYGVTGWRYLSLKESLSVRENLTALDPAGTFDITDAFRTRTQFNGFDLGINYRGRRGRWTLDLLAKLALGVSRQHVTIAGSTLIDGVPQDPDGGILAARSNAGSYSRDRFAVVPELGGTLGWQFRPCWRATVGYTFIYWSNVVRPGDQIDRDVNPNLFPPVAEPLVGASRPGFAFNETDFWAHGLNLGLEFQW